MFKLPFQSLQEYILRSYRYFEMLKGKFKKKTFEKKVDSCQNFLRYIVRSGQYDYIEHWFINQQTLIANDFNQQQETEPSKLNIFEYMLIFIHMFCNHTKTHI